jgi:hypothetical protein
MESKARAAQAEGAAEPVVEAEGRPAVGVVEAMLDPPGEGVVKGVLEQPAATNATAIKTAPNGVRLRRRLVTER